ncbi:hypothetical protein SEA_ARACELI_10 [Streptomyces phage Araceli]|nr:hypothetical protein SEA_ARACELI_10 [Streptomyces phage Araceli]
MSEKQKTTQTGDNPNKEGSFQADKFQYREGDIEWIKPPSGAPGGSPDTATPKALSKDQRRDLAGRIRAKLRLAAGKRPS